MTRLDLLQQIKTRQHKLSISLENISELSYLNSNLVIKFFDGYDVNLSIVEKITDVLGLDFTGNEIVDINTLIHQRARERALYIVSLVQDTSALEMQGLCSSDIELLIEETTEQFLTGEYREILWLS